MNPVKATLIPAYPDDDKAAPGSYYFFKDQADATRALTFWCPCGCGDVGSVTIHRVEETGVEGWLWDGNRECPTLTPSLQKMTGCKWHGHLTKGEFV